MIRLWDMVLARAQRELLANTEGTTCVALSPDGRWLATGSADGRIRLWNPETGTARGELPGHAGGTGCLTFGLGGQALVSGGRDGLVRLWDLARSKELKKFDGHKGAVTSIALTARGDKLASGGEDTVVRLRDTIGDEETARFRGHGGAVTALAFSPDGRRLASGAWDRSARVWDLATGEYRELMGMAGGVRALDFTADGREVLVGGGKAIRTWDPATGRPLRGLATLNAAVLAADLSPDATTLAVGGADGLIRLFDVATGKEKNHLEGHRGPVVCVAYGPGGKTLASASAGVSMATRPTRRQQRPETNVSPPPAADPEKLWADLAGGPRAAITAQRALGANPEFAMTLLKERLRVVSEPREPSSPEVLRDLRAIDLLARIGTPAARELLEELARGAPAAAVTDAAAVALGRLSI